MTDKSRRRAQSTADDVIFIVTRGRNNSRKHNKFCLGFEITIITGSRRVLDKLSRLSCSNIKRFRKNK